MDRRLTGIIVLIAAAVVIGLLVMLNNSGSEDDVAFAPARSADESVAAPDAAAEVPAQAGTDTDAAVVETKVADADADDSAADGDAASADTGDEEQTTAEPADVETVGEAPAETVIAETRPGESVVADTDSQGDAAQVGDGADTAETEPVEATDTAPEVASSEAPADTDSDGDAVSRGGLRVSADDSATGSDAEPAEEIEIAALPRENRAESQALAGSGAAADAPVTADIAAAQDEAVIEKTAETAAESGDGEASADGQQVEVAAADPVQPAQSAPAADPVPEVIPTFDVVRVEPSGDMVVAGIAEPESLVEILDGVETIAIAEANRNGEWAIVLEQPLAPGVHDLSVRTTSLSRSIATLSDQRVAVSVPEPGDTDVLVVLNEPGGASDVIQVPREQAPAETEVAAVTKPPAADKAVDSDEAGQAGSETVVAALTGSDAGAPATEAAAEPAAPIAEATAPSGDAAKVEVVKSSQDAPAVAETTDGQETTPGTADQPVETVAADLPVADAPTATASAADTPAEAVVASAPAVDSASAAESIPVAEETVVAEEPPEPVIQPVVTVTAVEAESSGAVFVAGTAKTDESVRVYLDNDLIGVTSPTAGGTWLVETRREMPEGTYQVRADQVDDAGEVISRAEVPFDREIEVAVLAPVEAVGAASGAKVSAELPALRTVIIKRGDNLWRISRKNYGRGIRYSTIYEANRDQIRNPRWIYPGQVFVLPEGNLDWTE